MFSPPNPSAPAITHYYHSQPYHHFAPQTPSPLRTSRNANLMPPPPPSPQWTFSSSPLDTKSSPLALPPPSAAAVNKLASPLSTKQPRRTPSSSSSSSSTFAFASRSRASTPQATLTAQTALARDRRKTLFRDRIRQQRDDARFEARGDQVLRMDFVKERREWEASLVGGAPADEEMEGYEEMDGQYGVGEEQEEGLMVPWTEEEREEREIEALAQYLLDREEEEEEKEEGRNGNGNGNEEVYRQTCAETVDTCGGGGGGGGSYGSDEEDYDQLFIEVISASQEQSGWHAGSPQYHWERDVDADHLSSSMDMS